jgi:F5/8 type C domain
VTRYGHAAALLLYTVLTVGLTWPVAARLGEVVPHDLGDPLLSTWTIWWNANVLPFTERWWDGRAFYPSKDTLTFSDHRVGVGLITTPAIWLGVAPLAAHNLAFLLSFFLSAGAAYALAFSLSHSRTAAFLAGLIFGFNPYRADHLPHLELLSSYWLPIVFLCLHQWATTLRRRWLALLGVSLVMLFLTSGYYFVFSGLLLLLWLAWFTPRQLSLLRYGELAMGLVLPLLVVAPVLLHYRHAHASLGLSRGLTEIEHYSADLSGLLTAPRMLAFWNSPESWQRPEGALLPGITAVLLVVAALWTRRRTIDRTTAPWFRRLRIAALALGIVMAAVATIPTLFGPVAYELGAIRISVTDPYKPLSNATLCIGFWCLTSARVRQAWRERSVLGFYSLATVAMWLFALGPTGRLFGYRVLYKAPYSWLLGLPGFGGGLRVPARFAMLAAMTLSVAAAMAFYQLIRGRTPRTQVITASVVAIAIMTESWIDPLPVPRPPTRLEMPATVPADAAVLELPTGIGEDAAALYRSIDHRRPILNGISGFEAPHYTVLRMALEERRFEALKGYGPYGPIAIFVERNEQGARMLPLLQSAGATLVATTATHEVLLLARTAPTPASGGSPAVVPIRAIDANSAPDRARSAIDGDPATAWLPPTAQDGTEQLVLDLGQRSEVGGVVLATTKTEFPRALTIELSLDQGSWVPVWHGDATAKAVATAIQDPRFMRMQFEFERTHTRYVRVRQTAQAPLPWVVFEAQVLAGR